VVKNVGAIFFGNFAVIVGFNPPDNRRDIDHAKKTDCDSNGRMRIRVWIRSALKCRHRYG